MSNFLTLQFWFDQNPAPLIPSMARLLLAIIVVFLIAAVVCYILYRRKGFYRPLWYKIMNFCAGDAVIGLILYFFSQQMIPFLSMKLWYGLWAILMIGWAIVIAVYGKKLPAKRKLLDQEKMFKKYLP